MGKLPPGQVRFECGCIGHYVGIFEGYVVDEHTCDGTVLAAQEAAKKQLQRQSRRRSAEIKAKPRVAKPFQVLR